MEIRPIAPDELPTFWNVLHEAFNSGWPFEASMEHEGRLLEFDRTLAAFEYGRAVATAAAHTFEMTVPGRVLAAAGVTGVGVLPSHRRRGLLTKIMSRQLADIRGRGEAVAALYASEAPIYGRFGYGSAAASLSFRIPRGAEFVRNAPTDPALRLRVAAPTEARSELEKVFDAVRPRRPGQYARTAAMWDAIVEPPEYIRKDGPLRCVLAEDATGPRGYALFTVKGDWGDDGLPSGRLRVGEAYAADPPAYALVWRHLIDRDLIADVVAERPVDDSLLSLVADPRRLHPGFGDDLWIRLVDLPSALERRSYSAPVDLTISVRDEVCPWNAGTWRLTASDGGVSCVRSDDPGDVELGVGVLGAAYLGGRSLGGLLDAGLINETRPGAVAGLSAAMSWEPRPWCGTVF